MGLTSWKNAPTGKIVKADVSAAKNYLSLLEVQDLNQFVSMSLDYAERQARRIPMTMEDWAKRLDVFLELNEEIILQGKGKVTAEIAMSFAEVTTYLNNGNIIFSSGLDDNNILSDKIELMIKERFHLDIPVYIILQEELEKVLRNVPDWWGDDKKNI